MLQARSSPAIVNTQHGDDRMPARLLPVSTPGWGENSASTQPMAMPTGLVFPEEAGVAAAVSGQEVVALTAGMALLVCHTHTTSGRVAFCPPPLPLNL